MAAVQGDAHDGVLSGEREEANGKGPPQSETEYEREFSQLLNYYSTLNFSKLQSSSAWRDVRYPLEVLVSFWKVI